MDRFDRIFRLHTILSARRTPMPPDTLMARLECSRTTLFRAVNAQKDQLNAPSSTTPTPVDSSTSAARGRHLCTARLWFSAAELQALAVMQRLPNDAGGGLLREHLGALTRRLADLTKHQRLNLGEAPSRLRFPAIAARPAGHAFGPVASATLQRKRLWIEYHARSTDAVTDRKISPQRIVRYREGWYLDAWDDDKDALRSFAIDRIRRATVLPDAALDIPKAQLDEHYAMAYCIFGGKAAVLVFTAERARWVADER